MKTLILVILVVFMASCQQVNNKNNKSAEQVAPVELKEDVLNIGKMHCDMCVASVEKGLKSVEGVEFVKVSLTDSTAVVRYDSTKAGISNFKEAVEKRGYVLKDKDL